MEWTDSIAKKFNITVDNSCTDDFIQTKLLKCMLILRHRQTISARKYDDPASKSKWVVFWETVSRYSSSVAQNEYGENSFNVLVDSLLRNAASDKAGRKGTSSISNSEWLPLHCCAFNSNLSDEHTKVLSMECIKSDENGVNDHQLFKTKETPLHLAISSNNPNMKTIQHFLKFFPHMSNAETVTGEIPLHYAAKHSKNVKVIELLIKAYPKGLERKCKLGEVPLFKACRNTSENSLQIVQRLLQASPHSIKSMNNKGDIPLHDALYKYNHIFSSCSLVNIIHSLLTTYPDSTMTRDIKGNTPLHLLCGNKYITSTFPVLDLLLKMNSQKTQISPIFDLLLGINPAAASVLNKHQRTPLHKLLHNGMLFKYEIDFLSGNHHGKNLIILVPMLLDVYPEAVSVKDEYNCFPIHYAVMNELNITNIERIINGHPAALLTRGTVKIPNEGLLRTPPNTTVIMTPLQLSLMKYDDAPVPESESYDKLRLVKYLYSRCPESILIRSGCNDTALHLAVKYGRYSSQKDEMVEAVYHMDPSAAMSVNNDGETPLFVATSLVLRNSSETAYPVSNRYFRFLLRICPDAATMINIRGISPLQKAAVMYGKKSKNNEIYDEVYRLLLQSVPGVNAEDLRRLNYKARRIAMFIFFTSIFGVDYEERDGDNKSTNIFIKIREFDLHHVVRSIVMFL